MTTESQKVSTGRNVHAGGPVCQGCLSHHHLLTEAIEMDAGLLAVTRVDQHVRLSGAKPGQAWREKIILSLGKSEV